jgi:Tol biopolymer transport system component
MRVEINTPATADPISFALSPDGRQIVFVASGVGASRLWLRSLAATAAQPLAGTEGAAYPFWSPDNRSIGFVADDKLKRLDIGGGAPQTLTAVNAARGGTWNADGVMLFTPTFGSPLFRVPASGGRAVAVTKLDQSSPAINRMEANGWTKTTVKPGDVITGIGYQFADGQKIVRLEKAVLADGKEIRVYGR